MTGDPRHFESIGNRLGFRAIPSGDDEINLVWRGGRFPALLCLGIACFLLLLSIPVFLAIHAQGLDSAVGNLWYFPAMNAVLFGVVVFLLTLKRAIRIDRRAGKVYLSRSSLLMRRRLTLDFDEVRAVRLGDDQVYSGFAVAGSTAGQKSFPARSLRLVLSGPQSVLLDRGGGKRLEELAARIGRFMDKPVEAPPPGSPPASGGVDRPPDSSYKQGVVRVSSPNPAK